MTRQPDKHTGARTAGVSWQRLSLLIVAVVPMVGLAQTPPNTPVDRPAGAPTDGPTAPVAPAGSLAPQVLEPLGADAPVGGSEITIDQRPVTWQLRVDAPDDLAKLLLRYLDLARYQRIGQRESITRGELQRLRSATPAQARALIRAGRWTRHTSGIAERHVQGNVVILPKRWADDFLLYCQRNPKPCPLLAVAEPGVAALPRLGQGIDIRHDVPRYRVWRDGELVDEPTDIAALWRDDLVTFVLGCSFSFEQALREEGLPLRHIDEGRNVAMFRTNVATTPVGAFSGPMVVSMRPFTAEDAIRAFEITARFPRAHGAPVHMGDPSIIGITDLQRPDYGDAVTVKPGETPVFWACGVTPQAAIAQARPEFCITHAPGSMLITDLLNNELAAA